MDVIAIIICIDVTHMGDIFKVMRRKNESGCLKLDFLEGFCGATVTNLESI